MKSFFARNTLALMLGMLFFASGFSALTLQTAWNKVLSQVIGIDYASQVVVVSIFMLGLGLGAWLGGFITRVTRHALAFFACEVFGRERPTFGR